MLSQYEPTVKATIAFLKLLKVKVNNTTVNETLQTIPTGPACSALATPCKNGISLMPQEKLNRQN